MPTTALATVYIDRRPGDTVRLSFGEYHRIDSVSNGGVFTLFISGPYQGTWGFLVDGIKVPWKKYSATPESCVEPYAQVRKQLARCAAIVP